MKNFEAFLTDDEGKILKDESVPRLEVEIKFFLEPKLESSGEACADDAKLWTQNRKSIS